MDNKIWARKQPFSSDDFAMSDLNEIDFKGLNFCQWRCQFRTSAYGIAMAIPRAEVQNWHLHGQKFRPMAIA